MLISVMFVYTETFSQPEYYKKYFIMFVAKLHLHFLDIVCKSTDLH